MQTFPLNDTPYTAEDQGAYHSSKTRGVFSAAGNFRVIAAGGMNLTVQPGRAWLRLSEFWGACAYEPADTSLTVVSPGNFARTDAVSLRYTKASNSSQLMIVQGTGNTAPTPIHSDEIEEIFLALIELRANQNVITAANIIDVRLDENYCGLMRDGVTGIPTEGLVSTAAAQLNEAIKSAEQQFMDWFNQQQALYLSDNVAGFAVASARRAIPAVYRAQPVPYGSSSLTAFTANTRWNCLSMNALTEYHTIDNTARIQTVDHTDGYVDGSSGWLYLTGPATIKVTGHINFKDWVLTNGLAGAMFNLQWVIRGETSGSLLPGNTLKVPRDWYDDSDGTAEFDLPDMMYTLNEPAFMCLAISLRNADSGEYATGSLDYNSYVTITVMPDLSQFPDDGPTIISSDELQEVIDSVPVATQAADTATTMANAALQSANNASDSAIAAGVSENNADTSATKSESWAVGGTNSRPGEDTNNAKYWAEQAQNSSGGGVSSFNGRTGAILPQAGDYTAAMVGASPTVHNHAATEITTGVLAAARGGLGIAVPTSGNYLRSTGTGYVGRAPSLMLSDIGAQGTAQKGMLNGYPGLDANGLVQQPSGIGAPISLTLALAANITTESTSASAASGTIAFGTELARNNVGPYNIYHWTSDGDFAVRGGATGEAFDVYISACVLYVPAGAAGNKNIFVRRSGFTNTNVFAHIENRFSDTADRQQMIIPRIYIGTVVNGTGYFGLNYKNTAAGDIIARGSIGGPGTWITVEAYRHYGAVG